MTFVSGEIRNPVRYLPLAPIVGTIAVVAIYLAANLACLRIPGIGGIGVKLVSPAVMISAFGTLNGSARRASKRLSSRSFWRP